MNLTELRADFTALLDDLLEDLVVDDVRNVNPPCVLVGLPTVDWSNHEVTQMVHVIAPGGNADDVDWMLATLTTITTGPLGNRYRPTTAGPGTYGVSVDRLYPAYEISYRIPQPATFCLAVTPPVPPPRLELFVDDIADLTVVVSIVNTDLDAEPPTVHWGDGTQDQSLIHAYAAAGTYSIRASQPGRLTSAPVVVEVTEPPPPPELILTVDSVVDLHVVVTVTNTDPTGATATVDWGDGTTDATRAHTYAAAGFYTLLAEQPGRSDSEPVNVTVTEPASPFTTFTPAYYGFTGSGYTLNTLRTNSQNVIVVLYGPGKVPLPTLPTDASGALNPSTVGLTWAEISALGATQVAVASPITKSGPPSSWTYQDPAVSWLYQQYTGAWGGPSFQLSLLDAGGAAVHTYAPITLALLTGD